MRRPRFLVPALIVWALADPAPAVGIAAAAACYPPPVDAPVSRPFDGPACDYCPGHRGLDYATRPGQPVVAVSSGMATFVGLVVRVRYVIVLQDDGRRATYGRLATSAVAEGARVAAGQRIGTTADVLFFGFRDGERYLDPAPLLGTWERQARLVPTDGSQRRPGPPPKLSCGKAHQGG